MSAAVLGQPVAGSLNREVFHADTDAPEAIVGAGLGLALFGGSRLVVVRSLAEAPAKAIDRLRAAIEDARGRPQGWPTEGTTVVLVAAPTDRRSPAPRAVPEPERVEVRPPSGRAVPGWLRERARRAGITLAPDAATALIDLVGEDLGRLAGEVDKAVLHAGADGRVSVEAVRALTGQTRTSPLWELTRALEEGKGVAALEVLERVLAAGEEPPVVLAWVTGYVRTLWRIHAGLAESDDPARVAKVLKPPRPAFAIAGLIARAQAVGPEGVAAGIQRCFQVDRALKTSAGSPRALLTTLVADLAR